VSESSTSLTGASRSDATDADASVLANDPTFTSCLGRLAPSEIARDEHGFVLTGPDAMKAGQWKLDREPFALETSAPGIFAVGDIRSGSVKRVAASVGEGGIAIAVVHHTFSSSASRGRHRT
jgi:thioredoxin reductase